MKLLNQAGLGETKSGKSRTRLDNQQNLKKFRTEPRPRKINKIWDQVRPGSSRIYPSVYLRYGPLFLTNTLLKFEQFELPVVTTESTGIYNERINKDYLILI